MTLPVIPGTNPRQVDDFYKMLVHNVQSLGTMGKLRDVTGNVRAVLDKTQRDQSRSCAGSAWMAGLGEEFYISHKAVVREAAESTKLRIVYDASARETEKSPFLNECLEAGPPLQNKLWAVLERV